MAAKLARMTPAQYAHKQLYRRQYRDAESLFDDGVFTLSLGSTLLAIYTLFAQSPPMQTLSKGFWLLGWLALGGGLLMLAYFAIGRLLAIQRKKAQTAPLLLAAPRRATKRHKSVSTTVAQPPPPAKQWGPEVYRAVEWRRFAAVCEALFTQAGFSTRVTLRGANTGTDIALYARKAGKLLALVRSHQSLDQSIPLDALRQLQQKMTAYPGTYGVYATTATLQPDARQFAQDHGIHVLEGPSLLRLIADRPPAQQQALLDVAYQGEYWRPTCPCCDVKMRRRMPVQGGALFWGCNNYPDCRVRLPMRHH
jgi:restriction system protein